MTAGPTTDAAICVGCGLCCDGTLYDIGKLTEDEELSPRAADLHLRTVGDRRYFRQPCRFHNCGRCSIYEERWTVCRTFRCALLRRYQAGEIHLADARSLIEQARGLVDAVAASDRNSVGVVGRRRVRRQLADQLERGIARDKESTGRRLIDIIALDIFLDR